MLNSIRELSYGVATTFYILAICTILLRIYSRSRVVKNFGWDDWCMTSILFFNSGHQAILYFFLQNGAGLHLMKVITQHPEWMPKLIKGLFAEEIMYTFMHFVVKTAFLLFYLRFATKTFRKLVYATIVINTVFSLTTILIYCFQCKPLDAFFNPQKHPHVKCIDNSVLAFVPAGFSIFVDVLIVILPIQPLWKIQASLRKRLALISILSLGGIVVLISCIRLVVLLEFQETGADFTYVLGKLIIISSIELEVAIMAANAPSLKILWLRWVCNRKNLTEESSGSIGTSKGYGTNSRAVGGSSKNALGSKRKSGWGSQGNNNRTGYAVDCSNFVPMTSQLARKDEKQADLGNMNSNGSEEQLWKHDSGIIVTTAVGVETTVVEVLPRTPEESEGEESRPTRAESRARGEKNGFKDQFEAV